jgi:hypothetical protein
MPTPTTRSLLLTVEEAAAFLRIGRSSAYELCRAYLDTGGREGIPCVRLGRTLRVSRVRLELLAAGATAPPDQPDDAA